jgi:hypothetical protein
MASFNNWMPVKLEAWEKKMLLIQDHEEIDREMTQVKEHLKQLELPQVILEAHVSKKYQMY